MVFLLLRQMQMHFILDEDICLVYTHSQIKTKLIAKKQIQLQTMLLRRQRAQHTQTRHTVDVHFFMDVRWLCYRRYGLRVGSWFHFASINYALEIVKSFSNRQCNCLKI